MALCRLTLRIRPTVTHVRSLHSSGSGRSQQEAAADVESKPEPFSVLRTQESDPAGHSEKHLNHLYTVPPDHSRLLFCHGFPASFQKQVKTFNESCIMVRPPALELISYLKQTDFSKPAQRYLFYGRKGTGKTMSLCHTVHFCYTQGWLVLHVPDAHLWVKNCKELLPSSYKKSRLDQPLQANTWLRNFKITNEPFLSKIKTTQRYVWTKREVTEEGSLLGELVDQGITRVKSSSDVVGALMKELRLQSGRPDAAFRLAVAVDGVNALWGRTTLKKENKIPVDPEELTLIYNLRKLMEDKWSGGAIITTLSKTGSVHTPTNAYLPQELLGERGFDAMDPFIPMLVSNYSEEEFESCYLYYIERNWLQHPQSRTEAGKKELVFLSSRNPTVFDKICRSL
ncbi:small ribosomal subunit protein mS29 [Austrofundulus limnaeus]|uniref:Small ribosomal subunit protein mS29 n=1 Tax=Austrofundulus limnaeus TaxID=52670 RepID=A0A2I4CSG4_AUSLI|nr:PREDICTED: 28S ribosomal protein S29, mitochondrial [Austrofundulus limnaeus]